MFAILLAAIVGAVRSAPAGADAGTRPKSIDRIVAYLQEGELESGAYAETGKAPSQSISAWVTLALAAAGVNPLDQTRYANGQPCGRSAQEWLEGHFEASIHEEIASPEIATTALERELLVVDTSRSDPHDFAGHDLVEEIVERQLAGGGFPYVPGGVAQINDAVFAILALAPVKEPAAEAAVAKGAEWLLTAGDIDGGYNWGSPTAASEVDLSGVAIEALAAAGDGGSEAVTKALAFLHTAQLPNGGFPESPKSEKEANVASTAWGVQGIWAAGQNPEAWTTGSGLATEEPLDYMESLQREDGHIPWKSTSDLNGIWMTAYVLPAFTGQVMPYPLDQLAGASAERLASCESTTSPGEATGGGGESGPGSSGSDPGGGAGEAMVEGAATEATAGVAAGGGGEGAHDFSRPRAGSKGKTPGGARVTRRKRGEKAADHARTRRGENLRQAGGTETAEPKSEAEADQEVAAVSAAAASGGGEQGDGGASAAGTSAGTAGGGGDDGSGRSGGHGDALPAGRVHAATGDGEDVSGTVIGSGGDAEGKLAYGAPGLRSAGRSGGGDEPWVPLAIGAGALALLGLGARRELRLWGRLA
jgi:hypothetical protein